MKKAYRVFARQDRGEWCDYVHAESANEARMRLRVYSVDYIDAMAVREKDLDNVPLDGEHVFQTNPEWPRDMEPLLCGCELCESVKHNQKSTVKPVLTTSEIMDLPPRSWR